MSTSEGPRSGPAQHRGELRLRMEAAFSAPQLRELATRWGLEMSAGWDRSTADAAHGLLREAEKRFGLLDVVRRLKRERPLVEWPDVDDAALAEWGPPSSHAASALAKEDATLVDAAPPTAEAPEDASIEAPVSKKAPPSAPLAPFPGTVVPAPPRQPGIDPKILIGVAAAMLLVTGLAFGAGILLSNRKEAAKTASSSTEGPRRPGPARMAAAIFESALGEVAERCEVEVDGPLTRDVLEFVQKDCGPASKAGEPTKRHSTTHRASDTSTASDFDQPPPTKKQPKQTDPDDPRPPPLPVPKSPSTGCMNGCKSQRDGCVNACGGEPGDASQYDAWQSCKSRCFSSESRCRMSCR
jgi:hypothetical protein